MLAGATAVCGSGAGQLKQEDENCSQGEECGEGQGRQNCPARWPHWIWCSKTTKDQPVQRKSAVEYKPVLIGKAHAFTEDTKLWKGDINTDFHEPVFYSWKICVREM